MGVKDPKVIIPISKKIQDVTKKDIAFAYLLKFLKNQTAQYVFELIDLFSKDIPFDVG